MTIVVLSDLRRPDYLAATLAAVDAAGARALRRTIVADADAAPSTIDGWPVVCAPKPPGTWRTVNKWATWAAFDLAAANGEDLLFLEDDVLPCARAVERAAGLAVPADCAWVSLYAPWGDLMMPPGICRWTARGFVFCQALLVPHRTLVVLAGARAEMERPEYSGSDANMAKIGAARGWHYGVHYPSLFQHVGLVSSVTGPGAAERTSRAWPGADFDAMSLLHDWRRAYD